MKEIRIEKRPESSGIRGYIFWFILLATVEIGLGALTPIVHDHSLEVTLCTGCALVATLIPFFMQEEIRHNRRLPELIEEYLDKELSEKDYKLLLNTARKYPALRPLVAAVMQDGKICYREAEPLVAQINQNFATKDIYGRQKATCPRRKLEKLVNSSANAGHLPGQDEPPTAG